MMKRFASCLVVGVAVDRGRPTAPNFAPSPVRQNIRPITQICCPSSGCKVVVIGNASNFTGVMETEHEMRDRSLRQFIDVVHILSCISNNLFHWSV